MLQKILDREDVKSFLAEVITQVKFNDKEIPNTICEEKISKEQYSLYVVIDAIIKYYIIIGDNQFDLYFEQLKRVMKKLQTHHDIVVAVNRLLIKAVKNKLEIKEETEQNKKKIIQYFYEKYIKEGYLYHSFSSYFYEEGKVLDKNNYYYKYEEMKEIDHILSKYKIEGAFSKNFDTEDARISFTDSAFMATFYSYHCPLFLYELCVKFIRKNSKKEIDINSFFWREYHTCLNNLDSFLKKKDIPLNDKNKILNFFKKEWKELNVSSSDSIIALIKRRDLHKDNLEEYHELLNSKDSLEDIVNRILDIRLNDHQINDSIKPEFYLQLPNINDILNKESEEVDISKENDHFDLENSYGNATIVALFGVLLIALGVTITIIMIGR